MFPVVNMDLVVWLLQNHALETKNSVNFAVKPILFKIFLKPVTHFAKKKEK